MTNKNLQKLKERFKDRRLKKLLIERSDESRANVNHVLNGRHKNQSVIDKALEILAEEASKDEQQRNLLR